MYYLCVNNMYLFVMYADIGFNEQLDLVLIILLHSIQHDNSATIASDWHSCNSYMKDSYKIMLRHGFNHTT